jgi:hypothetical protein
LDILDLNKINKENKNAIKIKEKEKALKEKDFKEKDLKLLNDKIHKEKEDDLNKMPIDDNCNDNFNSNSISNSNSNYNSNYNYNNDIDIDNDNENKNKNKNKYDIISLDNFKFILQHEKRAFAYDIFIKNEEELFRYESFSLDINYRLQPIITKELNIFKECDKIFVAFSRRDMTPFSDPIIISLPNDTTIKQMKYFIYKKLTKTKKFENLPFSKIKFYVYKLIDYKPQKEYLLINDKDEENIVTYFKGGGVRNVLVELIDFENENVNRGITIG